MQSFETLFRRAWERSREVKLRFYILLNWIILIVFAAAFAAAAFGAYYVLIEKPQARQSVIEVNPELRRIFAPKREVKFKDSSLSFNSRRGDKLRQVVLRMPDREIRAKSAEIRVDVQKNTVDLTLRSYRVHKVVAGAVAEKPASEENWAPLGMSFDLELPPGLQEPRKAVPGDFARGVVVIAAIVLAGVALWYWIWQMLSTAVALEAAGDRPTRMLRGLGGGLKRWWSVMYPATLVALCGFVGFLGSLPNILRVPIPFYLAIYPLACVLEITLFILSGIMMTGVAVSPPDVTFGDLLRDSIRVFLNAWGRYLAGMFWIYAFLALFAVMLVPGLVFLAHALVFGHRLMLALAIVWVTVWLAAFLVTGLRVRGCIAAYYMYLYLDAVDDPRTPEDEAAAGAAEENGGDGK